MVKSKAMPFAEAPDSLPQGEAGYAGFDPLRMSENMEQGYIRAAELKNGRVAMLAFVGMFVQNFVHLPDPAFAQSNPIAALSSVPTAGLWQIFAAIAFIELATFKKNFTDGPKYGFDPLGVNKNGTFSDAEVYNGRLAMIGSIGLIVQTLQTGKDPVAQLTGLF